MACFAVPAAVVIVTTAIGKKVPKKYHLNWLNSMLWGGVAMLAVEHIAHGEVVLYPPFLTASLPEVWPEMIKIGVPMTLIIFIIWGVMVAVAQAARKREKFAAV
ncbi:MAG: hypothetical protein FJZ15_03935 [Candidatus Omnitrophica bacterium]|nr:hypothetical protein [Candidatus Omnitrophota bacterium]